MESIGTSSTRPYYRMKLFFFTFVIVLLGALCAAAGLLTLFPSALGTKYGVAIMTLQNIDRMLVSRAAGLFAIMTGLLAMTITFLHLFYSHRIAGPAFRLGREAERIGRGELTADFQLRKKDNLTDLEDALKRAAHRYRETVLALDRHAVSMKEKAGVLRAAKEGVSDPALASVLQEMTLDMKKAEKLLSEIKT
jgi:methyl-accepting chemotaxis protein